MFPDPPVTPGLFFSFEGIDGSGKSTQARMLADALRAAGEEVVAVREPGGTPLGERVRSLLLDPESEITPRAEALLFAAARAELVADVIEPVLARGAHVIADRYTDSTLAYQGAGRQLSADISLEGLNQIATGGRMPARTYLITVSLLEAARRRQSRLADRMETPGDAFRERVSAAFDALAEEYENRIVTLDGREPAATLHRRIRMDALGLIGTNRRGPSA